MEPTFIQRRKDRVRQCFLEACLHASMEPTFIQRRKVSQPSHNSPYRVPPASMEPTFIQRRKVELARTVLTSCLRFNGADVYSTSEGRGGWSMTRDVRARLQWSRRLFNVGRIAHASDALRVLRFNGADVYSTSEGSLPSQVGQSFAPPGLQWSRRLFNVGRSSSAPGLRSA